ncbi:MAG: hypothetical protein A2020_06630 [Lentisphaerae bacterium GWF2_45_14]|nr:MAG: hypothetical protein A2020_06630 [Lentisphaerae bacterium GWF2_45_14]
MSIEDLFISIGEDASADNIEKLYKALVASENLSFEKLSSDIESLLDSWSDSIARSDAKANFVLSVAELPIRDSGMIRNAISAALKRMLPPYLARSGIMKGLGIRNSGLPLGDIAVRYRNLLNLKNNVYAYRPDTQAWTKVLKVDEFTSSLALSNVQETSTAAVSLEKALSTLKFFRPSTELMKLLPSGRRNIISSVEYRKLLTELCYSTLSDEEMKNIAQSTMMPAAMSAVEFDIWWAREDVTSGGNAASVAVSGKRRPSQGRSIQEMHVLLKEVEEDNTFFYNDSDLALTSAFFAKLKRDIQPKDLKLLSEIFAIIFPLVQEDKIRDLFAPLFGKVSFWPESFANIELKQLDIWGDVPAKYLVNLAKLTKTIFSEEYLAELATYLPLRCLNTVCAEVPDCLISQAVLGSRKCSSDILVWIWKNRTKHSDELVAVVNMESVSVALSIAELPKTWGAAQRELRKLLMDNEAFQKLIIKNAGDNLFSITNALQRGRAFNPGEHQSLLVKFSRHSQGMREILEKGEAKKFAQPSAAEEQDAVQLAPVTSVRSYKIKVKELDDIINIHTPENRSALNTARAHGDFRENAEYDAAKQRRDFLAARRAELESDINSVVQTDFRGIDPKDHVIVGTTVKVLLDSGKEEKYHIVGLWDGDPERHCVSYKTKLGEVLVNRKIGDRVTLPDGAPCSIVQVSPLPEELRVKLADEV